MSSNPNPVEEYSPEDDIEVVRVTIPMDEFNQRKVDERVKRRPVDYIDDDVFISQKTAAQRLDCAVNTFRSAVVRCGIKRHVIGGIVRYRWGEIREKILGVTAEDEDEG